MQKCIWPLLVVSLLLCPRISQAQDLGFKGIGARLGLVDADGTDTTVFFGAHVHLGELIQNLVLMPSIDYFSKNNVDIFSVNGNVRYYFPTNGNTAFFLGGGLAIVHVSVDRGPFRDDNKTRLGLNVLGGADFPLGDRFVATAKLIYVTRGDQVKVMGGITYMFGGKR
ncbi:MAG: hypothetical protein D6743_02625 [Calditrichaeota bacterium]|nr:MAG: hypothetical protein D6743_02625 [Calditrichota bacterium]